MSGNMHLGSHFPITDHAPIDMMLKMPADDGPDDGRSEWCWLVLQNGDLFVGFFPKGATYEEVETYVDNDWQAAMKNQTASTHERVEP